MRCLLATTVAIVLLALVVNAAPQNNHAYDSYSNSDESYNRGYGDSGYHRNNGHHSGYGYNGGYGSNGFPSGGYRKELNGNNGNYPRGNQYPFISNSGSGKPQNNGGSRITGI